MYNKKREDKFTDISSHKTSEKEKKRNPTEQQDEGNENKHKIIITKLVVEEVVQHVLLTELEDENDWYSKTEISLKINEDFISYFYFFLF